MIAEKIEHGTKRADALRPAVFDPADFEIVDYLDLEDAYEGGPWIRKAFMADLEIYGLLERFESEDAPVSVCDHCGNTRLRYLGIVRQLSSGATYVFGSSCGERAGLRDRAEFKLVQLTATAANRRQRAKLLEEAAYYLDANEDLRIFLLSIDRGESGEPMDSFDFVNSLDRALTKYGSLTAKQAAGLRKVIAKRPERERWEAEKAAREAIEKGPAPSGRQEIVGEIVSVKWYDGFREKDTPKMVVRLDNGSAVFTTVPTGLWDAHGRAMDPPNRGDVEFQDLATWLMGQRVKVTATFELSDKDPSFAFGKRPIAELEEDAS